MTFRLNEDLRRLNLIIKGDRVAWVRTDDDDGQSTTTGIVEEIYADDSVRVRCDDGFMRAALIELLWRT